jgi:hypothetical protein
MSGRLCPKYFLGRVFYFAFLGFLVLLLSGPALAFLGFAFSIALAIISFAIAILAVVLPFALLGFLIWAPLHALVSGKRVEWRILGRICYFFYDKLFRFPKRVLTGMSHSGQVVRQKVSGLSGHIRVILIETACGALVGFMLGVMADYMSGHPQIEGVIAIGALIGAVLGALVGISRIQTIEPAIEQTVEAIN